MKFPSFKLPQLYNIIKMDKKNNTNSIVNRVLKGNIYP